MKRPSGIRKQALRFLFACVSSFSVLAVCSKNSFLYPMNDWVDVNCFFTVGRGILQGMTPYLDLYEQKGPMVYFLYALGARISESSFLGVYLVEGLSFAAFLYLGGRISETLSGCRYAYPVSVPLLAILIPVTSAFSHGGSAEELILPVLAGTIWIVLKAMDEKRCLTGRQGFALGFCAAAAFWTKYTFCGLFAGMGTATILWYCFSGKARKLPGLVLSFTGGFLALSAAVAAWFGLKGALDELLQAYFVNNLTQYSRNIRSGQYAAPLPNLLNNLPWSIPAVLGLAWLAVRPKKAGWEALASCLGAVCLFLFTYASGRRYPYYALVMAAFAPLGTGAAGRLCGKPMEKLGLKKTAVAAVVLASVLAAAGPWIALRTSANVYLMSVKKEDMPQYRFAETIGQGGESSLLNYGFLDGGFYFAAGVLPSDPYFCTLNIDLPEMQASLEESVRLGKTEYVVTRGRQLKGNAAYELVDEANQYFEGRNWKYFLYRRKNPEEDSR